MADFPTSYAEAKEHIEQIRRDKGIGSSGTIASDLEAALILLSDQLYQKPSHFLLELIQNADDNHYDNAIPTLSIRLEGQNLWLTCNEVGFSKQNVDAICRIGHSTKAGLENKTRYTGEKGIGFKSVFKVADVVWIRSGYYSFKFDKEAKLGMLAPVWADFPRPHESSSTAMCLKLGKSYSGDRLAQEIMEMDANLLLFLRRLRRLDLAAQSAHGSWSTSLTIEERNWSADSNSGNRGVAVIREDDSVLRYYVFQFPVRDLPQEPKRPGILQTNMTLAFPLTKSTTGRPLQFQHVYAFLPIRDFGFKFLLHADFLLNASREDIDESVPWNDALRRMVPLAIADAVIWLNDGELRYSWPAFLPERSPMNDFFAGLDSAVIAQLATAPILDSTSHGMKFPRQLRYVPKRFCDYNGQPLVYRRGANVDYWYLSQKYSSDHLRVLQRLGVVELSDDEFLADVNLFVRNPSSRYREMSSRWHSLLSAQLTSLLRLRDDHYNMISEFPLIPLRDGRWVTSKHEGIVMSGDTDGLVLPLGIEVSEIDTKASEDEHRRGFFSALGVQDLSRMKVCDLLATFHSKSDFLGMRISKNDLVSHIDFMYRTGWTNPAKQDLWFLARDRSVHRGSEIYLASDSVYSASRYLDGRGIDINILDPQYLDHESNSQGRLVAWLTKHHQICTMPRIAYPPRGAPFDLSRDFQYLISMLPYWDILSMLRAHWSHYSKWLMPGVSHDSPQQLMLWEQSRRALSKTISEMNITSKDGKTVKLKHAAIPSAALLKSIGADSLQFLQITDPNSEEWYFLHIFGVITESTMNESNSSLGKYVHQLEAMCDSPMLSVDDVTKIYQDIDQDGDEIVALRHVFELKPLILIPDKGWYRSSQCRWLGEEVLRKTPLLAKHYPGLESFFCTKLKIAIADLQTIVSEMLQFQSSDTLQYISDLFSTLARSLPDKDTFIESAMAKQLRKGDIFPVRDGGSTGGFDRLESATSSITWLFADRVHLEHSFEGRVPFLAFAKRDFQKISRVIKLLGLDDRKLSAQAKAEQYISGTPVFEPSLTRQLRQKAGFVACTLTTAQDSRDSIATRIRGAKVYVAEGMMTNWSLELSGGTPVIGRSETGRGQFFNSAEGMEVYVTKEDATRMMFPIDIVEDLVKYSNTENDSEASWALHYIFTEKSLDLIKDFLDRRGLMDEYKEDWSLVESNFSAEDLSPKCPSAYSDRPVLGTEEINAMTEYLDRVDRARRVDLALKKNWESSTVKKTTLREVCRLEKQDPSIFMPLELLEGKSGPGLDAVSPAFYSSWPDSLQGGYSPTDLLLPGVLHIKKTGKQNLVICGPAYNDIDDDMLLFGELYVSRLLQANLGDSFNPDKHWTSMLRSRAGYRPHPLQKKYNSAFLIEDTSKELWRLLAKGGVGIPAGKVDCMTFHIDVVTVEQDVKDCPFYIHPKQLRQMREFSVSTETMKELKPNISILMVVSSILGDPKVSVFVDPWKLYLAGSLKLEFPAHVLGSFGEKLPLHMTMQDRALDTGFRIPGVRRSIVGLLQISSEKEYQYKTLASYRRFRLLELLPGDGDSPLQGKIHIRSLDSGIRYCAISYPWGAGIKPYKLFTPAGIIWITASCDSVLRSVRDATQPKTFWIDAVCIDQAHSHEKTSQIRLMRDIFHSADSVYGWIGAEADDSRLAIQTLLQIRALQDRTTPWNKTLPRADATWASNGIPAQDDEAWKAIDLLFMRPWFSRAWITQEMVLASKIEIICGTVHVPWNSLFEGLLIALDRANKMIEYGEMPPGKVLQTTEAVFILGRTRQLYTSGTGEFKFDLLTLLDRFSYTEASLEADKLFALLGLASDADNEVFNPDYSSLEEVVHRYAQEFVYRDKALDLLYRAGGVKSDEFSSWIPCWTKNANLRTISTWDSGRGSFEACSGEAVLACPLPSNKKLLQISVTIIDYVVDIGDKTMKDNDVWGYLSSVHEFLGRFKTYPTGESIEQVQVRLPIGDAAHPYRERADDVSAALEAKGMSGDGGRVPWGSRIPQFSSIENFLAFFRGPTNLRESMWKYWQTVSAFSLRLSHGRVFSTRRRFAGLGPPGTVAGDLVALIHGASVPFILRPAEGGDNDQYQLMGECYLHGAMHGEARDWNARASVVYLK